MARGWLPLVGETGCHQVIDYPIPENLVNLENLDCEIHSRTTPGFLIYFIISLLQFSSIYVDLVSVIDTLYKEGVLGE